MYRRLPLSLLPVVALASCNSLTGIDDITIKPAPPAIVPVAADGVTITEIAVYQGLKRSVLGGTPSTSGVVVPIVEGRDALVRVFVKTDETYDKSDVTARLTLGKEKLEIVGEIVDSVEEEIATTLNFDVPGNLLEAGVGFSVELTQPSDRSKGKNKGARHPEEGTTALDVSSSGEAFKLLMLPIKYGADGSNRLPDMSEEQMKGFADAFLQTYPTRRVELVMHEPIQWNKAIYPNGSGWDDVLDAVAELRQQEGTPRDTYIFGFFNPATSFNSYCKGGCVSGLGMIGEHASDDYPKAAVGLGFPGYTSFSTAIHEVGHTQGRHHADCGGAQSIDPKFPYPDAGIGVWGYDILTKALIQPDSKKDMMGYCDPYWISDYTFEAIFTRMKVVSMADVYTPEELRNQEWERARVGMDGELRWLDAVKMESPPFGRSTPITVLRDADTTVEEGHFFAYDHLPGGVLLWRKGAAPSHAIQVTLDGATKSLSR